MTLLFVTLSSVDPITRSPVCPAQMLYDLLSDCTAITYSEKESKNTGSSNVNVVEVEPSVEVLTEAGDKYFVDPGTITSLDGVPPINGII